MGIAAVQQRSIAAPYGAIANKLKSGDVIPFLGAGASMSGRPANATWTNAALYPPSGRELAEYLAQQASFPSDDPVDRSDLAKVASYYVNVTARDFLLDDLRSVLDRTYSSGDIHKMIASVAVPLLVVVTNYDTLMEQAFQAAGRPFDVVVYPADRPDIAASIIWWKHGETDPTVVTPNQLDLNLKERTVIYKMHGTISHQSKEWDNFVITEEDYVDFLSRMTSTSPPLPAIFSEHLAARSFLFLGYGLRDWNLRVVLNNMSRLFKSGGRSPRPSWAIQRSPSEVERRLWEKRNVNIFDESLDDFAQGIQPFLR